MLSQNGTFKDSTNTSLTLKSTGNKDDIYFLNTKNHTVQVKSGNDISYRYDLVTSGRWFQIPRGISYIKVMQNGISSGEHKIKYNYKYY